MKKKTSEEKADLLGERLIGGVPEVVAFILNKLQENYNLRLDSQKTQQALFETLAFYMHIIDRMAFQALGADGRTAFGDRLVTNVASSLASSDLVKRFRDTYNKRQLQYAAYGEMFAPEGNPPKGTLVWEFGKVLFELTGDSNPVTLVLICVMVADWTPIMIRDALKVEEVMKS